MFLCEFCQFFVFGQNFLILPNPYYPSGENVLILPSCTLLLSHSHYNITLEIFIFSFNFRLYTLGECCSAERYAEPSQASKMERFAKKN